MPIDKPIKLDIRAAKLLFAANPKEDAIGYLAGLINEQAGDDATFQDFQRVVTSIKQKDASYFISDDHGHHAGDGKTASERLEDSNRKAALQFQADNPTPGRLDLTDAERARLKTMSAVEKSDFANKKYAELRDGKK